VSHLGRRNHRSKLHENVRALRALDRHRWSGFAMVSSGDFVGLATRPRPRRASIGFKAARASCGWSSSKRRTGADDCWRSSRVLAIITALGTTGTLSPKVLNAARMRPASSWSSHRSVRRRPRWTPVSLGLPVRATPAQVARAPRVHEECCEFDTFCPLECTKGTDYATPRLDRSPPRSLGDVGRNLWLWRETAAVFVQL
jgi:hypothetical protein